MLILNPEHIILWTAESVTVWNRCPSVLPDTYESMQQSWALLLCHYAPPSPYYGSFPPFSLILSLCGVILLFLALCVFSFPCLGHWLNGQKKRKEKVIKWELACEGDCAYKRHMFKKRLGRGSRGGNTDEACSSVGPRWGMEGPCLRATRSDVSLSDKLSR